jgi:lysophospholipase L1-like esterase
LKATNAQLIWANTTPVPPGEAGRIEGDAVRYNAVAEKIMQENGIVVNDLHAHILPRMKQFQTAPDNVHFTSEGSRVLAEKVAASIREQLDPKTEDPPK